MFRNCFLFLSLHSRMKYRCLQYTSPRPPPCIVPLSPTFVTANALNTYTYHLKPYMVHMSVPSWWWPSNRLGGCTMAWLHRAVRQGSFAALKVPSNVPFQPSPLTPATTDVLIAFIAVSRMPCMPLYSLYIAFLIGYFYLTICI